MKVLQKDLTTGRYKEVEISNALVLRILTLKSVLLFGKYKGCTIEKVITLNKHYLQWIYYNIIGISFDKNALTEIGITQLIPKPGSDTLLWAEIVTSNKTRYTTRKTWLETIRPSKCIKKDHIRLQISTEQNKARLQRYNQGHRN